MRDVFAWTRDGGGFCIVTDSCCAVKDCTRALYVVNELEKCREEYRATGSV